MILWMVSFIEPMMLRVTKPPTMISVMITGVVIIFGSPF